ncbi:MAG TPA: fimbrial protein [Scandinavium sp.]|jgi:type 1 fimbria pilin
MAMNKLGLTTLALVMTMGSASVMAADAGLVVINGAVSDQTCKITTKDGALATNVSVQMPTVTSADVIAAGGVKATTLGAGQTSFELLLTDCDKTGANISFSSPEFVDVTNGTLKNNDKISDHATNVNVAIHDVISGAPVQVLIGRPDDAKHAATMDTTAKTGIFKFVTSYVQADTNINTVTGGLVSTNATFDVTYD